jgi:hypothetical protein
MARDAAELDRAMHRLHLARRQRERAEQRDDGLEDARRAARRAREAERQAELDVANAKRRLTPALPCGAAHQGLG